MLNASTHPRHFTNTSQFRSSRSGRQFGENTNRTRTGQIDHDVFEGLPVRRWTRQSHTVSQAPKPDESESIFQGPGGKQTLPEHPMPRDSQLLTPTSKALLRAARAGCIYIRQNTKEPEDEEKETLDPDEQPSSSAAAAAAPKAERSFVARKWTTVPRHMEPPEIEFLAKRRPGLPSLYGASAITADGVPSPPMRRTRFTRVDAATGNVSIYEAWVPEGFRVEGEIAADAQVVPENPEATVVPETPASGTVVEGVGTVNDEGVVVAEAGSAAVFIPKRRPPPPKRKGKGFKGRRKKVMFAPGEGGDASAVHGAGAGAGEAKDGVKEEDGDASRGDQAGQEEEEEDGEEGEESDEGEESMVDAKTPETPLAQANTESTADSAAEPSTAQQAVPAADAGVDSKPQEVSQAPQAPAPDEPSHEQATTEDVHMADAQPSEHTTGQSVKFESQPPPESPNPAPGAQPTVSETTEKEAPQPAEQSIPTEDSTGKPSETIKTEGKEADQDVMDTSADQPAEPAPAPEQPPKHETLAENNQSGNSLETSSGGPAVDAQAEAQPEQTSGVSVEESPAEPAPEQVKDEKQSTEQVAEQPASQPPPAQAEGQAPETTIESAQQSTEQQQASEQPTTAPTTEEAPEQTTEQTAGQTAEQPPGQEEQPEQPKEEKTGDQTQTQQVDENQQQEQEPPAPAAAAAETEDPSPSAPAETSTSVPAQEPEPEPTNEAPAQTEESQPKPAEASDFTADANANANPEIPTEEDGKKEANQAEHA